MGDVLHNILRMCILLDVDPVFAVQKTITKIGRRYSYIDKNIAQLAGGIGSDQRHKEMRRLWGEAKKEERLADYESLKGKYASANRKIGALQARIVGLERKDSGNE